MPTIRGRRDTRDWADEFNNEGPVAQTTPFCPACWEDAPEGTYPPSLGGSTWWCGSCMKDRIRQLRGGETD